MQLVEQGVLDLDTDINAYLDGVEIPAAYDEPVTLRHVLTHSAGFEDWVIELFGDEASDVRPLAEILAAQTPARVRPPGEVSSYSNHATGMAALIVEQAAGCRGTATSRSASSIPGHGALLLRPAPAEALALDMSKGYADSGPTSRRRTSSTCRSTRWAPRRPRGAPWPAS